MVIGMMLIRDMWITVLVVLYICGVSPSRARMRAFRAWAFIRLVVSAWRGDALAQYNLGVLYERGIYVTRNYRWAVHWFRMSAQQGCTDAQYNLGLMLYFGRGADVDKLEALLWFGKAAAQGDVDAIAVLVAAKGGLKRDTVK